jgi:hypothetical protein
MRQYQIRLDPLATAHRKISRRSEWGIVHKEGCSQTQTSPASI